MALDFPSNPVNGQTYNNFYYDGTAGAWRSLGSVYAPNYLKNATFSTTATTGVPLTAQGITAQSANLQEWKDSSGTVLANVDANGILNNTSISTTNLYLNRANSSYEGGQINFRRSTDNTDYWYIDVYGNTSTPSLRFLAGSQTNMQLDASGRVMMPNQPAFYVQGSGTYYLTGSQVNYVVPMSTVSINIGSFYNTSTYRFIAPVSGTYYFWMQACTTDASSTGPEINLLKNGTIYNNAAIEYNSAYYNTFGGSMIVSLSANDYVQMAVTNNNGTSFTIEQGRSRFAGHLIG